MSGTCDTFKSDSELLCEIAEAISNSSSSGKDFEFATVKDANGVFYQLTRELDEQTGNYTILYLDASGNSANPVSPLEFIDYTSVFANILTELQTLNNTNSLALAQLTSQTTFLSNLDLNTDDIETLLGNLISEVQNGNTVNANNLGILHTDLQNLLTIILTQQSTLGTIASSIVTADANNTSALSTLQTSLLSSLNNVISELQAVNVSVDGLEAGQSLIENAINNNTTLTVDELQDIETILNNSLAQQQATVSSLSNVESLLTSISNNQNLSLVGTRTHLAPFTGSVTIPANAKTVSVHIRGNGGTIDGALRPNRWTRDYEYDNDLNPAMTFDGNGTATFYVDYML